MMTLRRFRMLAGSYGGDLQRWPARLRPKAAALLEMSTEARAIITQAHQLDEAIMAAGAAHRAQLWAGESPDAAQLRLRNSVYSRIAITLPAAHEARAPTRRRSPTGLVRWIGFASAASAAILVGLTLGILYSPPAPHQEFLALLQPAPLQLLTD